MTPSPHTPADGGAREHTQECLVLQRKFSADGMALVYCDCPEAIMTNTHPTDTSEELRDILAQEFSANGESGYADAVFGGKSDPIIKAALAAMSRARSTHAGEGMVEAIKVAEEKAKRWEATGLLHAENTESRDRCFARSRAANEIATALRALSTASQPQPERDALASPPKPAAVVGTGPKWQSYDHEDKSTWPTQVGVYRVMVSGDSESLEGHTIYEYSDYPTWAEAFEDEDEDNGEDVVMFGQGTHDEEADMFFAYCGPISIPEFSEKALTPPQSTEEKS